MDYHEKRLLTLAAKVIDALDGEESLDPAGKAAVCRIAAETFAQATTAMTLRAHVASLLGPKR